mmetsp:Transcript_32439/g.64311  ORF Transcript_32439/g.64311 Transcript_32439/m.64311 type:complete len:229 (-) Transcript_32439:95-781(-)
MYVVHAVHHDGPRLFDARSGTHHRHSVPLHEHVALRQELQRAESGAVRAHEPLPPLYEPVLVADHPADLDNVAVHVVVQDFQRLGRRDGPREQPDQVPRLHDRVRVPRPPGGRHGHGPLDQVELARHLPPVERAGHDRPHLAEVAFAIFRKKARERALLQQTRFHHNVLPLRLLPFVHVRVDVRFGAPVLVVVLLFGIDHSRVFTALFNYIRHAEIVRGTERWTGADG